MTPLVSMDSMKLKSEHTNADETEEKVLKNNLIKMIEVLNIDVRKSIK